MDVSQTGANLIQTAANVSHMNKTVVMSLGDKANKTVVMSLGDKAVFMAAFMTVFIMILQQFCR